MERKILSLILIFSFSVYLCSQCLEGKGFKSIIKVEATSSSFKLLDVTLTVLDENGNPVQNAWVRAFSKEWGVMYPHFEEWGKTDSNGVYRLRIPSGSWIFLASSGWDYANSNPNKGFFVKIEKNISEDTFLVLRPQNLLQISILNEVGSPLPVDELYVFLDKYIPAIPPAFVGKSTYGSFTLLTGGDSRENLTLLAFKRPSSNGYLLKGKLLSWESHTTLTAETASKISFKAYNADGSLSYYWDVEFRLPELFLGNWVYTFQLLGETAVYVSPMKIIMNPRFIPPGWYYYFEHISLETEERQEYSYSFGGRATFNLWVIKDDTQLYFDIRDEFGNVLAFYSDPQQSRYIRFMVFEGGTKVFDDNVGQYIPGTLFYGVGQTFSDSSTFSLDISLGPLGELNNITLSGLLYDEAHLCQFRQMKSEHFEFYLPVQYFWNVSNEARDEIFINALEMIYASIRSFTGEDLEGKPHTVEVNFEWCGVGGTDFVGFGVGVARWPVHIHHGWLGVLSHELGHMYSFTPPLLYGVECPWFCEPLATYLGIEGVAGVYGHNTRLWYWGTHPGFFDYIAGDTNIGEIERMQFIFFYLHKTYGPDVHVQFFQVWNTDLPETLFNNGFNTLETVCVLYSCLVQENLAWLFQMAGFDVSESQIAHGIELVCPIASVPFSSMSTWKNSPDQVALVVGASYPHGPIPRGSLTDDVVGSAAIAGAIGSLNSFLDTEVADYIESSDEVIWKASFTYNYVIAVGGPFVNLLSYKFRDLARFSVEAITENGHRLSVIWVNEGGIYRCYINQSDEGVYVEYENGTKQIIGHIGDADFAVLEMHYDAGTDKYVAVIFGITRFGSVASARWVALNLDNLSRYLGNSQAAILEWHDLDVDGSAEANEIKTLVISG